MNLVNQRNGIAGFKVAYATSALFLSLIVILCWRGAISYDGTDINTIIVLNGILMSFGIIVRIANRGSRIGDAVQAFGLFGIMAVLASLASAVLAKGHAPYVDGALDLIDRQMLLGHDWKSLMIELAEHPTVLTLLSYAYVSLNWQPLVLFAVYACWNTRINVQHFMAVWAMGLLGCCLFFHWLPAQGAYVYYGIPFEVMHGLRVHLPWDYPVSLAQWRDGSSHILSSRAMIGLITVPSFHACAAVMLAWAFRHIPVLRWPMGMLNAAMFVSAIPVGGHYVADVIVGGAVALLAITSGARFNQWPVTAPSTSSAPSPFGPRTKASYAQTRPVSM